MGDLFTSSSSTNSVKSTDVPKNYQTGLNNNLDMAANAAAQPFNPYTSQRVADFNAAQNQALSSLSGGMGQYDPLLQAAAQSQQSMIQNGGLPSASDIQGLENPYTAGVIGQSQNDLFTQYQKSLNQLGSNAAQSGAFGGSRQGVEAGVLGGNYMNQANSLYYQGMSDNYNQAVANWFQGQNNQRANNTSGVNIALGGTNQNINQANALLNAGGQQRDVSQQNLDFAYQQFAQQQAYPWQQTDQYAQVLDQYPRDLFTQTQNSTQTSTPSLGSILMGGAMMAAGAMTGNPSMAMGGASASMGSNSSGYAAPSFNTQYIPFSGMTTTTGYGTSDPGTKTSYGGPGGYAKGGSVDFQEEPDYADSTGTQDALSAATKQLQMTKIFDMWNKQTGKNPGLIKSNIQQINRARQMQRYRKYQNKTGAFAKGGLVKHFDVGGFTGGPFGQLQNSPSMMVRGMAGMDQSMNLPWMQQARQNPQFQPMQNQVPPWAQQRFGGGNPQNMPLPNNFNWRQANLPQMMMQDPRMQPQGQAGFQGGPVSVQAQGGMQNAVGPQARGPMNAQNTQFAKGGWIKGAVKHPGLFTAKAKSAGKSVAAYAQEEKKAKGKLGAEARFAARAQKGFAAGGPVDQGYGSMDQFSAAGYNQQPDQQLMPTTYKPKKPKSVKNPTLKNPVNFPSKAIKGYADGGAIDSQGEEWPTEAFTNPGRNNQDLVQQNLGDYDGPVANVPELGDDEIRSFYAHMHGAEGSGNNPNSSAGGFYQFTKDTLDRNLKQLGYTGKDRSRLLSNGVGGVPRPIQDAAYNQVFFPNMVSRLQNNGIPLNERNLYLAHHYNDKEMKNIYGAMAANPDAKIQDLVSSNTYSSNKSELGGKTAAQYAAFLTGKRHFLDSRPSNIIEGYPSGGNTPSQYGDVAPTGNNALRGNILNLAANMPTADTGPVVEGDRRQQAIDSYVDQNLPRSKLGSALNLLGKGAKGLGSVAAGMVAPIFDPSANTGPDWSDKEHLRDVFSAQDNAVARDSLIRNMNKTRGGNTGKSAGYLNDMIMSNIPSTHDTSYGASKGIGGPPTNVPELRPNLAMSLPYFAQNQGAFPRVKPSQVRPVVRRQTPKNDMLADHEAGAIQEYLKAHPDMIGHHVPGFSGGGYVKHYDRGGDVDWGPAQAPQDETNLGMLLRQGSNWSSLPVRGLGSIITNGIPRGLDWFSKSSAPGQPLEQGMPEGTTGPSGENWGYPTGGIHNLPAPPGPEPFDTTMLFDPHRAAVASLQGGDPATAGMPPGMLNKMSGNTPAGNQQDMFQSIINQRMQEMKDQQQEQQQPLFGLFSNVNMPLMRAGLALMANSNKNFGEALGTAGLQEMGMEEKDRMDQVNQRNAQLKDLFNMQYMRAMQQQMDPAVKQHLADQAYARQTERDAKLQQYKIDLAKLAQQGKIDAQTAQMNEMLHPGGNDEVDTGE